MPPSSRWGKFSTATAQAPATLMASGAAAVAGYSWFNPNNQSTNTDPYRYDSLKQPRCTHSQLSAGAMWQQEGFKWASTVFPVDSMKVNWACHGAIWCPLMPIGEQALQLTLAPYLLHEQERSTAEDEQPRHSPRPAVQLMGYGQYDELSTRWSAGNSGSFGLGGGFVNDPNASNASAALTTTDGQASVQQWPTSKSL